MGLSKVSWMSENLCQRFTELNTYPKLIYWLLQCFYFNSATLDYYYGVLLRYVSYHIYMIIDVTLIKK